MFAKTYELSLTRNYVSKWGMPHAVRELIQNALDSESPFVYEFKPSVPELGDGTKALYLTSEFAKLLPQTLLLGSTSKADSKDSIGSFGEGYKIALLVLTRLGFDIEMRNGEVLWKPRFRHSRQFGEELLVIDETSLPDKTNKGLTVVIGGLSEADELEIRQSCLQMQDGIGQVHAVPHGQILLERPGTLYVGGLFITKTEMHYGYNVKPEFLKLERDRQTVSAWDLGCITKDMWFATGLWDDIAKMIETDVPDVEYAEYGSPELVKEACYRLFLEKHPGKVPVKTGQELKDKVRQHMTVTISGGFYSNVSASASYRSNPVMRIASPTDKLQAWFDESKFHMHDSVKQSFRDLIKESNKWTIR